MVMVMMMMMMMMMIKQGKKLNKIQVK